MALPAPVGTNAVFHSPKFENLSPHNSALDLIKYAMEHFGDTETHLSGDLFRAVIRLGCEKIWGEQPEGNLQGLAHAKERIYELIAELHEAYGTALRPASEHFLYEVFTQLQRSSVVSGMNIRGQR